MKLTFLKHIKPHQILLFLFAFYIVIFLAHAVFLKKTVYGDGIYYYSWVRSLVVDHDISFHNEYAQFGGSQPQSPLGLTGNVYSIGPALFWFPTFMTLFQLFHGNGYSLLYQLSIGFISCLYVIAGVIILFRLLQTYFSEKNSILTVIGIMFGTNLLFYGAVDTVNSHSLSFFIATILITFIVEKRSFVLIGFFAGLLSLMRTQDAIFLLLALPLIWEKVRQYKPTGSKIFHVFPYSLLLMTSFFLAFVPQLIAWQLLYGTVTKSPYMDNYHFFDIVHPHLFEVLFSTNNGLILWTPLVILCLFGCIALSKRLRTIRIPMLGLVILQWFLIASWSFWWQGASFSGRMFISILPLLSLGLASVIERMRTQKIIIVLSLFCVLNFGLILVYLLTH